MTYSLSFTMFPKAMLIFWVMTAAGLLAQHSWMILANLALCAAAMSELVLSHAPVKLVNRRFCSWAT